MSNNYKCSIFLFNNLSHRSEENQNLYLTISSHNPEKAGLTSIVKILKTHCSELELKRVDETNDILEASFLVEFEDFQQLEASRSDLKKLSDAIKITFLDNKGIRSTG